MSFWAVLPSGWLMILSNSISSLLPPWSYSSSLLYSIKRANFCFLGPHHTQSHGSRCHVLVLFQDFSRRAHLVERMDHQAADFSIHHWYWWACFIFFASGISLVPLLNLLGFIYFASYNVFASKHYPTLPLVGQCAGTEFSALAGCTILSSYLLLFIWFYLATYGKSSQKSSAVMEAKEAKGRSLWDHPAFVLE